MKTKILFAAALIAGGVSLLPLSICAQIGTRFPSEKTIVPDPLTGAPLSFLTSKTPGGGFGDQKIYQTHPQWTADGKWLVFRSTRVPGQAMAVNEDTGVIVQLTDKGYQGMLLNARHTMKLYFFHDVSGPLTQRDGPGGRGPRGARGQPGAPGAAAAPGAPDAPPAPPARGGFMRSRGPFQIVELDLTKVFADSEAGTLQPSESYERVCCTLPSGIYADGDMAIDATDKTIYLRVSGPEVMNHVPAGLTPADFFMKYLGRVPPPEAPRGMTSAPSANDVWRGLVSIDIQTGDLKWVTVCPFGINHTQTNGFVPGEIVFAWETGGKAPQRTWIVEADGSGLRPLYPESDYEWVTHESAFSKDEAAVAILAMHRPAFEGAPPPPPMPGMPERAARAGRGDTPPPAMNRWGDAGNSGHATGVGIVNLRTREMRIVGQVPLGDPARSIWHVNGSSDGRWAVADDFQFRLWIIDRHTGEMMLLAGPQHMGADHIHPTFNADNTRIEIQSALLSGRALNICVVPVPKTWLARTYSAKVPE